MIAMNRFVVGCGMFLCAVGLAAGGDGVCVEPVLVGSSIESAGFTHVSGVAVDGTTAYISVSSDIVGFYDISDPAQPVHIRDWQLASAYAIPWDLEIRDSILYVAVAGIDGFAHENQGLRIFDVSDPSVPVLLSDLQTVILMKIQVVGDFVYALSGFADSTKLHTIFVGDPGAPVLLSTVSLPMATDLGIDLNVVGDRVYIADNSSGLLVYHSFFHTILEPMGSFDTGGNAHDVEIVGSLAYVADGIGGLKVIDVSDPGSMRLVGSFMTDDALMEIHIVGTTLYGRVGLDGLVVLDVSDPASITEMGSYLSERIWGSFTVSGDFVYGGAQDEGMYGIDVVDVSVACETVCMADLSGDGFLNMFDVSMFLSAFGNQDLAADFTGEGDLNFLDVSAFLAAFGAGCP